MNHGSATAYFAHLGVGAFSVHVINYDCLIVNVIAKCNRSSYRRGEAGLASAASIEIATIEFWRKNYDNLGDGYCWLFARRFRHGNNITSMRGTRRGHAQMVLPTKRLSGYLGATG